ncbi:MAG: reverse transcriptase family protein, partial [Gloeomargaritales cyanobacterium]
LLLKAMPIEWQRSFTLAGHRINTTDLLTLEEYFVETESIMDSTRGHKDNKKKKDGNDSSDANGDTEKKKKGNRKSRKPQSQGGNGKSRTRLDNDATCPIHGKHKWGQCYENRFGENYKPPTAATSTTSANDQSKKSSKSKKDAHATESVDDDEDTEDSFLCQEGTSVADTAPYDLHFFDAETEMETEEYDRMPIPKTAYTPLQVDLPTGTFENSIPKPNLRQARAKRREDTKDLVPETLVTVCRIGDTVIRKHYNALIDSGASVCMIAQSKIPHDIKHVDTKPLTFQTTNGLMKSCSMVYLCDVHLPEFSKTCSLPEFEAYVYDDSNGRGSYDLILGRDFLFELGMTTCFQTKQMKWGEISVPFHRREHWRDLNHVKGLLDYQPYRVEEREEDLFSSQVIQDSKYESADPSLIAATQDHLTVEERKKLSTLLQKYSKIFDGTLGKYPHEQVHLKLKPNSKPIHAKPYSVPRIHQSAFRNEIDRLVELDVLEKATGLQWASPAFIIPKRDGSARFIADFRALNLNLERDLCPLPDMRQIIQEQAKFTYITKLDLSMGYFHLELDPESSKICTIVVPWGKYRFKRLPLGVHPAVDIFQALMQALFQDFEKVRTFLDDLKLCTSESFDDHLQHLGKVLQVLLENNLSLNVKKCEWAVQSTE